MLILTIYLKKKCLYVTVVERTRIFGRGGLWIRAVESDQRKT